MIMISIERLCLYSLLLNTEILWLLRVDHISCKTSTQVLVKFDMEVECLNFDEDRNASFGQHNMVHYVIFERNLKDFLSTYRIIDKVLYSIRYI